jgi:transcriptional regulator of acetoin/glycerol metabolism
VILAAGDTLQVADLPLELRPRRHVPTSTAAALTRPERRRAADENERATLLDAMTQTKGNVSEAAKLSGYSRAQFYRLLRKHHIKS